MVALAVLVACGSESVPVPEGDPPAAQAAAPAPTDGEVVNESNLLDQSRYWPYRVAVLERWDRGPDLPPVQANRVGVLIRVEPSGNPRIDFGGYGNLEIPVASTDVLERANRIRLGEDAKPAPNFTYAIRTRMLSSEGARPSTLPATWADARQGFLCVFADPESDAFESIAVALAPLRDRHGVGTILFPQGTASDARVHERLHELGWLVPFLPDFLSEPYTMTLLPELPDAPFVLLQTDEGRVLHEGPLSADVAAVETALDRGFGDESALARAVSSGTRP